jgi:hypothetical protein
MQIDESDEQDSNPPDSIHRSLEPDSKVTLESATHCWKQSLHSISTDDGMQIDETAGQDRNANLPIRESFEPDSSVTLRSASQPSKQPSPSRVTGAGMKIDESDDESANPGDSVKEHLEPWIYSTDKADPQKQRKFRGKEADSGTFAKHETRPSSIAYPTPSITIVCSKSVPDARAMRCEFAFRNAASITFSMSYVDY